MSNKPALVFSSDVMSLGITLVGHQKKIMSSIQTMRAQMLHLHGTGIQVWHAGLPRVELKTAGELFWPSVYA